MQRDLIEGLRTLRRGSGEGEGFRDGRQVFRVRCLYQVQCRTSEGSQPGEIVDIGLGGMKLRCSCAPSVGTTADISYLSGQEHAYTSVPCRVEWVRGRERDGSLFVGLTYDATHQHLAGSWVKLLLRELGFRTDLTFQRRRYLRAEGTVPVRAMGPDGAWQVGRLSNLGVRGALIEGPLPYSVGTPVRLEIGPLENLSSLAVEGTVTQTSHDLCSVRFADSNREVTDILGAYLRQLLLDHWE